MASLLQSPILRAAAISGVMLPIGEVMCQLLREEAGGQPLSINWAAVARMSAIGTTLHGPFFFTGLRALDAVGRRHFPGRGPLASALLKAALGQLTLTPVYVASFFTYSGGCTPAWAADRLIGVEEGPCAPPPPPPTAKPIQSSSSMHA